MEFKLNRIILIFFVTSGFYFVDAQTGTVTVDQDSDIERLLEYKKDIRTSKIFKIQVYQSIDPDKAQKEKVDFLNIYSQWPVEIEWNTPNYKVWVGNFTTRLEADRALKLIKKNYMNAIIFQPKQDKKKQQKKSGK